jgi:hypothetical protein
MCYQALTYKVDQSEVDLTTVSQYYLLNSPFDFLSQIECGIGAIQAFSPPSAERLSLTCSDTDSSKVVRNKRKSSNFDILDQKNSNLKIRKNYHLTPA